MEAMTQSAAAFPRVSRFAITPVRLERLSRGLRLLDVANETGICIASLSEIERGLREPTIEQHRALARLYRDEVASG